MAGPDACSRCDIRRAEGRRVHGKRQGTERGSGGRVANNHTHAAPELRRGGRHNVMNALAAAAAATAAGAKLEHVAAGLGAVRAGAGRLQFKMNATGAWLIDNSYNANPSSVRAGIEVLAGLDGRKWLVLGDMAELGDFAESSHTEIGVYAREHGIEQLFATGALAALAVESFGA